MPGKCEKCKKKLGRDTNNSGLCRSCCQKKRAADYRKAKEKQTGLTFKQYQKKKFMEYQRKYKREKYKKTHGKKI